jgi:hypothetical protein
MAKIKKIKLGTTTYDLCDADAVHSVEQDGVKGASANRFGLCTTGATTAAKTASITTGTFTLTVGAKVTIKFTNKNTANSPTLNVNSQGAKAIFYNGSQITTGATKGLLYGTVDFVYDGTQWQLIGTDMSHTPIVSATASSILTGATGTANTKIATGTNVGDLYIPVATATAPGTTIVYPKDSCTSFSSDTGTVTPAAAQKAAKQFAITRPPQKGTGEENTSVTINAIPRWEDETGDLKDSKILIEDVTNTKDTTKKANVLSIPAEDNKKMVYGYCTDQVDGTSFIGGVFPADATEFPYSAGLAIGGTTGNLLWKSKRVLDTADVGTTVSKVGHKHSVSTSNAAPQGHTHTVTVSGTSGANSGTAVSAVTGYPNFAGGSGSLTVYSSDTATTAETAASSGRIPYVASISSTGAGVSGTAKAGSETHTHTYNKATLSGSNSSHTVKYMKFSAGTTPKSGATPVHTSTNSGANSGTTVTALTGVKVTTQPTVSLTANTATATGRITYVQSISSGSGSLVAYDALTDGTAKTTNGNRIPFITSLSTGGYTPAGSVSLTDGTAPSMNFNTGKNTDTPYISALTNGSYTPTGSVTLSAGTPPNMGNATTKYLSASASGTAVGANGTGSAAPSGHTHAVTVSGTTGNNSGTAIAAVTGYPNFSGGKLTGTQTFVTGYPNFSGGNLTGTTTFNTDAIKSIGGTKNYGFSASTSDVMYSPKVSNGVLSWSVTSASTQDAHSGTAASTGTVGFTAASLGTASTGTVGFTAASLGTASTSNAAPHTHTHGYGSATALTTGANSGTAITALTGVKVTAQPTITLTANTSTATGRITYVEAQGSFSAGTTPKESATFSGNATTALVTSGTTKYMKFSAGTTPKSGASFTGTNSTAVVTGGTTYYLAHGHTGAGSTTRYLSASASGTAVGANGTASVAPSGHTHSYAKTTSITLTDGTAPSMNFNTESTDDTPYVASATNSSLSLGHTSTSTGEPSATTSFVTGVSGGTTTATTKYLKHTHSGASLGSASTSQAAPAGHTHSYGSSTALTTTGNSGTAVAAVTEVKASTD